jgi:hypothetical protein
VTEERRKHSRVRVKIEARGASFPSAVHAWSARVVEMTLHGLTVRMSRALKPETECALTLEGGLRCSGAVVHSRRAGEAVNVGIRLLDMAPVQRFKLLRYIQNHQIPAGNSQ